MAKENGAFRLTNKTAIRLRQEAERVKRTSLCLCAGATVLLCGLGVYWGIRWLPAVALCVVTAALFDALMTASAERRSLELLGEALCAENAARSLREIARREQAQKDREEARQDVKAVIQQATNTETKQTVVQETRRFTPIDNQGASFHREEVTKEGEASGARRRRPVLTVLPDQREA